MPNSLSYARYCDEIVEQTRQFRDTLRSTTLGTQVPTCPEWTVREMAVHVGDFHRMVTETVRRRASEKPTSEQIPGFGGPARVVGTEADADADVQAVDEWLETGARGLAEELLATPPDEPMWTGFMDRRARFWARRVAHEVLIHRADAAAAAEIEFEADSLLAADCLDEWLEIVSSPLALEHRPTLAQLATRAGSTVHLHATDSGAGGGPEEPDTEWLITLRDDGIGWQHGHEKADVAVRGPLTDILLVFQRRLPPTTERVQVLGDTELLDLWLDLVRFE
jgi:uncharacterized protein (TIGR03083 family)